jgi:prepilin-type N-terminal cleavage/methylation domain-containing protein
MVRKRDAFTLLELLAAVSLLVILGTMVFQIFDSASEVVRTSASLQEIFQYGRAALDFLERELTGGFTGVDAQLDVNGGNTGVKGMRIYHNDAMGVARRSDNDSQAIFFSSGVMARDMSGDPNTNPFFGHDVNCARIAYYMNPGPTTAGSPDFNRLEKSAIYRSEMYDLTIGTPQEGWIFVKNCLYFKIMVLDQYQNPPRWGTSQHLPMDWNSDANRDNPNSSALPRRGLPYAISIQMRITDERHAKLYRWNASDCKWYVPGPEAGKDYWGEEDPVVQSFRQVVYFGRRPD